MSDFTFKTEPYQHQRIAFDLSKDRSAYALFMEMGTGKSKVILDSAVNLYLEGKLNLLVVFAPKSVFRNWLENEVPRHIPDSIPIKSAYWSAQPTKGELRDLDGIRNNATDFRILCVNIEAMSHDKAVKILVPLISKNKTMICVDESTTIKNMQSKRTKTMIALAPLAKYRRIVSGTPVTQSPLDLYAQCAFLERGLLGHTSYFTFRNRYAEMKAMTFGSRSFNKVVGYKNLEELQDRLKGFSYRCMKKDCLDLPEKVYEVRHVEMSEAQRKQYNEFRALMMLQFKSGEIATAKTAMTKFIRLHQICCGHIGLENGEIMPIETERPKMLMEILEEVSGKAIIWCNYIEDVYRVSEAVEKEYGHGSFVRFHGDTPIEQRVANVHKFQNDDGCRFFIGTPKSGGFGLTLTAASHVIYYSNGFSLETRLQSEDRAHRIGQKNTVTYIDMVAKSTVDERIMQLLKEKRDVASSVMDNWENLLA